MSKKLSTDPYKGVRDFCPSEMFIQNYIFSVWRDTLRSFGYDEYGASPLEPSELYKAKSGDEIVNEQTYSFIDRGDREVTLRPEMTPTVARMVAKKYPDVAFPMRWFSMPNLFRYERPQRGRLREHFQLNVDIFGVANIEAETEIIEIASTLLRNFGLNDTQFEIKVNSRMLLNKIFEELGLNEDQKKSLSKLIDKKNKIDDFDEQVEKLIGKTFDFDSIKPNEQIEALISKLNNRGISNIVFSPEIMRGFDYYTDIVFEVYDTHEDNNRALFGGGRYDNLTEIFGVSDIPIVGFGQGDVTMRDVLETYNLLPERVPSTQICLCPLNEAFFEPSAEIALSLRERGVRVSVDYTGKKVGDQVKKADKRKVPYVAIVGEDEIEKGNLTLKKLSDGSESTLTLSEIPDFINSN